MSLEDAPELIGSSVSAVEAKRHGLTARVGADGCQAAGEPVEVEQLHPDRGGPEVPVVRSQKEAAEIPGIEVSAVSRMVARRLQPVYDRMNRAVTAHFRTEKDFVARGHPSVGSMLRGLPRVKVQNRGMSWLVTMGGAVTLTGQPCVPTLYLDGMRVSRHGDPASLSEFLTLSTLDVAVIEVYPGAASLPAEFNDPGTMCAIGIWTRRGG